MPSQSFVWSKRDIVLLVALQLSPVVALAALATHDLAGTPRAAPTTMGALEVKPNVAGVVAPTGLLLTVQRIAN